MSSKSIESTYSFAAIHNRLRITGKLVATTALRIGTGRDSDIVGNDLPVLRDALNNPFIPGASIKGSLRARMESLIRTVAPSEALDLLRIEERMREGLLGPREQEQLDELRQEGHLAEADKRYSDKIWNYSTMIDLTFGAPWLASRLFVRDANLEADFSGQLGLFEVRNGVALNRDTETAEGGMLYDYEVVPAGVRFDFELVLENGADWQLGMILLALKPWERGDVQIGGFRSRGLGYVQLIDVERQFISITNKSDTKSKVAALIGLLNGTGSDDIATHETDWVAAFQQELVHRAGGTHA